MNVNAARPTLRNCPKMHQLPLKCIANRALSMPDTWMPSPVTWLIPYEFHIMRRRQAPARMGSCRHRGGTIRGARLWSYYKNELHRKPQGVEVWPILWTQHNHKHTTWGPSNQTGIIPTVLVPVPPRVLTGCEPANGGDNSKKYRLY